MSEDGKSEARDERISSLPALHCPTLPGQPSDDIVWIPHGNTTSSKERSVRWFHSLTFNLFYIQRATENLIKKFLHNVSIIRNLGLIQL